MKSLRVIWLTVLLIAFLANSQAFSLPEGEKVENGSATFERPDSSTLNVTASDKAVINFNSFNIAQNERVNFIQPSINASVLSRVIGPSASEIAGNLSANGNANVNYWPGNNGSGGINGEVTGTTGGGMRGGCWTDALPVNSTVSDRRFGTNGGIYRSPAAGGRLVRTSP